MRCSPPDPETLLPVSTELLLEHRFDLSWFQVEEGYFLLKMAEIENQELLDSFLVLPFPRPASERPRA